MHCCDQNNALSAFFHLPKNCVERSISLSATQRHDTPELKPAIAS